jgi:hypothetical protein
MAHPATVNDTPRTSSARPASTPETPPPQGTYPIRGLFCAALDELEIPWTRPGKYQVAVYRKAAVARLDEFVGPKA